MHRLSVITRSLAAAAFVGLATFPVVVVILNLVHGARYHPLRQAMSELALGRAGWLMAIAFSAMGAGTLLLAVVLRRTTGSRIAPVLLAIAGLLDFVSASIHTDPSNAATTTTHGTIHNAAGIATFGLVVLAMFISARTFRRDAAWRRFARPTLVWAVCAVGTFFLIPALGDGRFGLAQRIFVAAWLSWLLAAASYARRLPAPASQLERRPHLNRHPNHDSSARIAVQERAVRKT
jgi:Protein of unknown function (DUF998)